MGPMPASQPEVMAMSINSGEFDLWAQNLLGPSSGGAAGAGGDMSLEGIFGSIDGMAIDDFGLDAADEFFATCLPFLLEDDKSQRQQLQQQPVGTDGGMLAPVREATTTSSAMTPAAGAAPGGAASATSSQNSYQNARGATTFMVVPQVPQAQQQQQPYLRQRANSEEVSLPHSAASGGAASSSRERSALALGGGGGGAPPLSSAAGRLPSSIITWGPPQAVAAAAAAALPPTAAPPSLQPATAYYQAGGGTFQGMQPATAAAQQGQPTSQLPAQSAWNGHVVATRVDSATTTSISAATSNCAAASNPAATAAQPPSKVPRRSVGSSSVFELPSSQPMNASSALHKPSLSTAAAVPSLLGNHQTTHSSGSLSLSPASARGVAGLTELLYSDEMLAALAAVATTTTAPGPAVPAWVGGGTGGFRGGAAAAGGGGGGSPHQLRRSSLTGGDSASSLPAAGGGSGRGSRGRGGAATPSAALLPPPVAAACPKISKTQQRQDTTRKKNAEIAKLEQEMAERLRLVDTLEAEKEGLQRKERLLKLQVRHVDQAVDLSSTVAHPDLPSSTHLGFTGPPGLAVATVMAASQFAAEGEVGLDELRLASDRNKRGGGVAGGGSPVQTVAIPVSAAAARAGAAALAPPGSAITPHLVALLQSFRSTVSRSKASQLMANIPTSLESFSIRDFATTWTSFVEEVSDVLMQQERKRAEMAAEKAVAAPLQLEGRRSSGQACSPSSASAGSAARPPAWSADSSVSSSPMDPDCDPEMVTRIEDLCRRVQGYCTAVAYCRPTLITRAHNVDLRAAAASPPPQQLPLILAAVSAGSECGGGGKDGSGKGCGGEGLISGDGDIGKWELIPEMSFWREVAAKLRIQPQQKSDLLEAYHLYSGVLKHVCAEQTRVLTKLLECLENDLKVAGGAGEVGLRAALERSYTCRMPETCSEVEERIREYLVVSQRCHIPHIMLSFLVLNLLTPWQRCLAVFHSYPSFLNLKLILAAICEEDLLQEQGGRGGLPVELS